MLAQISNTSSKRSFELPSLPFEINALEPFISQKTLELHHGKLLQVYINNLNNLVSGTKFEYADLESIIRFSDGPVFNNAAQTWNHLFFFEALNPASRRIPEGSFADMINSSFGSFSFLKDSFMKSAASLFGSGWIWLVRNPNGPLEILIESNAGNPMRRGKIPLLGCDLWEHAYYLDYQNRRFDYVDTFWKLVNWSLVEKRYINAR
jgi:Fe-Mn family superoxide dismutase